MKYFFYLTTASALLMNHPAWGGSANSKHSTSHQSTRAPASVASLLARPIDFRVTSGASEAMLNQKPSISRLVEAKKTDHGLKSGKFSPKVELASERNLNSMGISNPLFNYTDIQLRFR